MLNDAVHRVEPGDIKAHVRSSDEDPLECVEQRDLIFDRIQVGDVDETPRGPVPRGGTSKEARIDADRMFTFAMPSA